MIRFPAQVVHTEGEPEAHVAHFGEQYEEVMSQILSPFEPLQVVTPGQAEFETQVPLQEAYPEAQRTHQGWMKSTTTSQLGTIRAAADMKFIKPRETKVNSRAYQEAGVEEAPLGSPMQAEPPPLYPLLGIWVQVIIMVPSRYQSHYAFPSSPKNI